MVAVHDGVHQLLGQDRGFLEPLLRVVPDLLQQRLGLYQLPLQGAVDVTEHLVIGQIALKEVIHAPDDSFRRTKAAPAYTSPDQNHLRSDCPLSPARDNVVTQLARRPTVPNRQPRVSLSVLYVDSPRRACRSSSRLFRHARSREDKKA